MKQRKIKFRAWNIATKTMVDLKKITPFLLNKDIGGLYIPESDGIYIMQYTGLKDRTGREIYEGDILKATYLGFHGNHGQTHDIKADGIVVFDYAQFKIDTQRKTKDGATIYKYFNQLWPDGMTKVDCEVIGNVYENPGLLKQ